MPGWLLIALQLTGTLVPVATLIGLAIKYGRVLERVDHLTQRVGEISTNCLHCQDNTRNEDAALHTRVTELDKAVAGLKATVQTHGERLTRVEGRLNGHH